MDFPLTKTIQRAGSSPIFRAETPRCWLKFRRDTCWNGPIYIRLWLWKKVQSIDHMVLMGSTSMLGSWAVLPWRCLGGVGVSWPTIPTSASSKNQWQDLNGFNCPKIWLSQSLAQSFKTIWHKPHASHSSTFRDDYANTIITTMTEGDGYQP